MKCPKVFLFLFFSILIFIMLSVYEFHVYGFLRPDKITNECASKAPWLSFSFLEMCYINNSDLILLGIFIEEKIHYHSISRLSVT